LVKGHDKNKLLSQTYHYFNPLLKINIYLLIGIIEGDGSFYIGLRKNKTIRFGFNITTHIREIHSLYGIQSLLNCGHVRLKGENWCRFEIESYKTIKNILIPVLSNTPLLSSKSKNYQAFILALDVFNKKEHLTEEGFKKIVNIAYNFTNSKAKYRKYSLNEFLKSI